MQIFLMPFFLEPIQFDTIGISDSKRLLYNIYLLSLSFSLSFSLNDLKNEVVRKYHLYLYRESIFFFSRMPTWIGDLSLGAQVAASIAKSCHKLP